MRLVDSAFAVDVRLFHWCQQRRYKTLLIQLARLVSRSADGHLYLVIGALAIFFQHTEFLIVAASAFALERVFYFVLKHGFRRNRPPDILPDFESVIRASDQFSFPSGHTSAAFLMTSAIVLYFPVLAAVLYPWAICVGWSRVMLGVHFPGDTFAGSLLGTGVLLLVFQFYQALVI